MSSIREVAKQAGVSPATVSRTFSMPDLINEHTQKRVLEAARLLDYRPPHLRSVKARRTVVSTLTGTLGFQFFAGFPEDTLTSNVFYAPVLSGALAEADAQGLHLLVHTTDRHSMGQEMPRMVREQAVGGLLLVGATDAPIIAQFANYGFPIVLVDNSVAGSPFESVMSDGSGGALMATQYLFSLGHRRIAFLMPEEGICTFSERLYGFIGAHYDAGIPLDTSLILRGFTDSAERSESRRAALIELLQRSDRPTAIFCGNDAHGIVALQACRSLGLRVPEDISIIGFDDIPFTENLEPALTTVKVDKEQMGRLAVQRLLAQIKGETALSGLQLRMPVSLVIRGSCRKVTQ